MSGSDGAAAPEAGSGTVGYRELFAGYRGKVLISTSLAWFGVVMARLLLPPLLPAIIEDFTLSLALAGGTLTAMQMINAIFNYPSGRLADELSRATLIVPGLVVLTLGVLLIAVSPVYLGFLAGVVVLGLGAGLFTIAPRALISDHYVDNRGKALGIFAAAFNLGGFLASVLAAILFERWRLPFVVLAVMLGVITVLFVYWNREPYDFDLRSAEVGLVSTAKRILTIPELRGPLVAFTLFYFVTRSFLGFFPIYLTATKGFSTAEASIAFALVFVVGGVSKVYAGAVSDRFPRKYVSVVGLALAMLALGGIVLVQSVYLLAPLIVLFAVGHQSQFPLVDAILMDAAPADNVGGDLGAAKTVFFLVGSIGPTYVGVIAQTAGYSIAFAGLVVCLLACALLLLWGGDGSGG
jgi:MFS family permease